jgi:hypothetical protein
MAFILHFSKENPNGFAIGNMKMKGSRAYRQERVAASVKWIGLSTFLLICAIGIIHLHTNQMKKLAIDSEVFNQKSRLISQMHNEMLLISRTQLELLQASNDQQVKNNLRQLSDLVSNHLIHYYQFKKLANESDAELLMRFRIGFQKWYEFNDVLLGYANAISDTSFINTLNKVDLAFSQLDQDDDAALLLISQLK